MSPLTTFLLALALAAPCLSNPTPKAPLLERQTCMGQSCIIAALSGSSGQPFNPPKAPDGGTTAGDCCILKYNPSVRPQLTRFDPNITTTCPAPKRNKRETLELGDIVERAACLPYTLLFARGTFENGTLGVIVGPALAAGLEAAAPGKWNIVGVPYDASTDGDACLGLPGGAVLTPLLESTAKNCPNTKIIVSGYSQGALVAHNVSNLRTYQGELRNLLTGPKQGIAYASAAAKKRVTGVVVFGDPFDVGVPRSFGIEHVLIFVHCLGSPYQGLHRAHQDIL